MNFSIFLALANTGDLKLPLKDVQALGREAVLLEWERLRDECQNFIDRMVIIRIKICRLALDTVITPSEFTTIMDRIDDIEDSFRGRELTAASLVKAKHQTKLVLDLLKLTLGN